MFATLGIKGTLSALEQRHIVIECTILVRLTNIDYLGSHAPSPLYSQTGSAQILTLVTQLLLCWLETVTQFLLADTYFASRIGMSFSLGAGFEKGMKSGAPGRY